MNASLLSRVQSPEALKALSEEQIPELCTQIRDFLTKTVEKQGGHLASNLGVVELTVALHRVFSSPEDRIIFDVGHQSYVHKLLTGRGERFDTLRTPGGLCGFTSRRESLHDPFGAGHSSTALSAALGFAEADRLAGRENYTIAVVGDGAYTGGMVHEALNNCHPELRLIVVLNENKMSISQNKGRFASYLSRVRVSKGYRSWKQQTKSVLSKVPLVGKLTERCLTAVKGGLKRLLYHNNYFEELGLYYMGPMDGNDYKKTRRALEEAKQLSKTVIVHLKTTKGKGLDSAEQAPEKYHALVVGEHKSSAFHTEFAKALCAMASEDGRVVAVTAAMGIGTGLSLFEEQYPDRYFDVGIAEPHALTFSAGLCAAGLRPYAAIYSTFLQRGYDNILHDIALQGLPVHLMIDRASLSVGDGATHHGMFDVAFLSHIPGVALYAPATYGSLRAILEDTKEATGPVAIRYPNAGESEAVRAVFYPGEEYACYGARADYRDTPPYVMVTYGKITERVLGAKRALCSEGYEVGVVLLEQLAPYDQTAQRLLPLLAGARACLFVEEGVQNGGAGMILKDRLSVLCPTLRCGLRAIDESFAAPSEPVELYDSVGLSEEKICAHMLTLIEQSAKE